MGTSLTPQQQEYRTTMRAIRERAKQLKKAYRQFLKAMNTLTKKQVDLMRHVQGALDEKQIEAIRRSLGKF